MWYHLLNCGFPVKVSGETDFPCMSGLRVGQGRVYVRLGDVKAVDFDAWCAGLAAGRSYVSDGFAHALEFTVGGRRPGERLAMEKPGTVPVRAKVAFAAKTPMAVAHGSVVPAGGRRLIGDTVDLHGPERDETFTAAGETRLVELVVNGRAVASREVPADERIHNLEFDVPIPRSSWVALRHFPQFHTNPVDVLVGGRPDPRLAPQRPLVPGGPRTALEGPRNDDRGERTRRSPPDVRSGYRDLSEDRVRSPRGELILLSLAAQRPKGDLFG